MKIYKITTAMALAAITMSLTGCMEEVEPTNSITKEQIENMESAQETMLGGIISYTNEKNIFGYSTGYWAEYTNDYGYPCQMYYRDVLTADFPIASTATFNYWQYVEGSTDLRNYSLFTYNYYYHFIKNCNNLIEVINPETASSASLNYLGCALTIRALCYLDMARMFEFQPTGIEKLDGAASDVWGLTVPITLETSTEKDLSNSPRAPFYTMYRFILSDLNKAVEYLDGYKRPNGNYPDKSVAYGMLARLWLEIATRFDKTPADLTTQLSHEADEDGFSALDVSSTADCYKKAADYARLAIQGYTPMTKDEWTSSATGFNTATNAWMLYMSISTLEQEGNYYSSHMGSICTEATWAMPQYGASYREISSSLYNSMGSGDWRRNSWIAPEDAGNAPDAKYNAAVWTDDDKTSEEQFKKYPAYTNLKFRSRDNISLTEGMKCDIPMMRVEEMFFILAEAKAHTDGVAAGASELQSFMNTYRYTDGSYTCNASDIDQFTKELITQKRIELWGEGLSMFDYKRLKMQVNRSENENYSDLYRQDSKEGYVSPAMNYFIPDYAKNMNNALILNPDCTGWDE